MKETHSLIIYDFVDPAVIIPLILFEKPSAHRHDDTVYTAYSSKECFLLLKKLLGEPGVSSITVHGA